MKLLDRLFGNNKKKKVVASPRKPRQPKAQIVDFSDALFVDWENYLPVEEVAVNPEAAPTKPPLSKIPQLSPATMSYAQTYSGGRGMYSPPEYDLAEIGVIEDVDGYVAQSFQKKLGLMFKEGFEFISQNKKFLKYYEDRHAQISKASGIPTSELLRRTCASLIRVSNAFLIKVRQEDASGGKIRTDASGKTLKPVAAYFPAAPETMRVDIDQKSGKIMGWRHQLPNGQTYKDFPPENVVHFTINKREGFIFGTPTLIPVIDDIRALRQIEENIELLVYQHLFPLFHYIVGTETAPAGYTEQGDREIDVAKREIRYMPSEGGIITPERHEIKILGAENKALRAEIYVEHFKKRVIAGLGISSVDLGEGDTANRATANTMSRALIDTVKSIQDQFEAQWDQLISQELMLEAPQFGDEIFADDEFPELEFNEIDIDNRIERDKHALEMFKGFALTYPELREKLSLPPIKLPENADDQDPVKYPEWFSTYWKLIEEPSMLIRAVDEPYSLAAQALAKSQGSTTTQGDIGVASKAKEEEQKKELEAEKETKIAVAKAKPKPPVRKDSFLTASYSDLELDTVQMLLMELEKRRFNREDFAAHFNTWVSFVKEKFLRLVHEEVVRGFSTQTGGKVHLASDLIQHGKSLTTTRIEKFFFKFTHSLLDQLERKLRPVLETEPSPTVARESALEALHASFASHTYRLDFALTTETEKGRNFGKLLGMRYQNFDHITYTVKEEACEICQGFDGQSLAIEHMSIEDITPHHPGCRCGMIPNRSNKE
jgi:hypothetical protein